MEPRRSAGTPPEPQHHLPRRSAPTPPGVPPPHDPLPRRSATTPPEIPEPVAAPADGRRRPNSAWLSSLMAPLVVVISVALGLGIAHLAAPRHEPGVVDPRGTPTVDSPSPAPTEPPPSPTVEPGELVELNDASLTVPAEWTIASDELVEGDRRAVRLVEPATDARLQALTLGASEQTPAQACEALVELQRQAYSGATTQLMLEFSVPGAGEGVTCGFEGTRTGDGVPNLVSFTLLSREVDGHLLMLRATVPEAVPAAARARTQLVGMQCEASRTFGVRLPLC